MADGNITVTLQDLRGAEAKEQALWAERGRWLAEKLSERTTPDGRAAHEPRRAESRMRTMRQMLGHARCNAQFCFVERRV